MVARQNYPSVRHLICVAGPPCSGKTHALRALQRGQVEQVDSILPAMNPEGWPAFAPGWVPADCPENLDQALFHYDFLRVWKFGGKGGQFDKDPVLDIFRNCERIDFVTLATSVGNLRDRFAQRSMKKMIRKTRGRPHAMMNLMICFFRLRRLYRDPELLKSLYSDWLTYTAKYASEHTVINSSGSYHAVDLGELDNLLAGKQVAAAPVVASEEVPARVLA